MKQTKRRERKTERKIPMKKAISKFKITTKKLGFKEKLLLESFLRWT